MDRRQLVVAAVAVAVLVVLAAASGSVRVWTTPSAEVGQPSVETVGPTETVAPPDTEVDEPGAEHRWTGVLSQIVGVLIILAVVLALVSIGRWARPRWRRRPTEPGGGDVFPLPELPEHELNVDVDAARAALAVGEPRNAIVACWMQLERDASEAGLPRSESETSAEYVERVVAASSVDPVPIGELAALYREARFSRHDLNDEHRTRAFAALSRVAMALRRGVKVPT
ncbi:MAG TPA: DUF4129 domain-containing protein [Ilumatobacteraceae bacterium]|jgi:hypothetical protein